jgi:hypothetical protein
MGSSEIKPFENWGQVADACEGANPGQPATGRKEIRFTQHCEITLALDMLNRTQSEYTNPKIEIGVSKACCEWCCQYLKLLASTFPQNSILVRASHGKQPSGWMMPPNNLAQIRLRMVRIIEGRVDNVLWKIHSRRRRSDSNELPSFTREDSVGAIWQIMEKRKAEF